MIVTVPHRKTNKLIFNLTIVQVILSFDYVLELLFLLDSGVSMIQVIVDKLHLLSQREGLTAILDHNIALMIERTVIATLALLITGDDMDNVVCLQCGMAPKTVLSDGNSKVSYTRSGARVLFQVLERGGGDGPSP